MDTVTSIGGARLLLDEWLVDACYAGSQKNLACPPGIAPLTLNERALEKLRNRKGKVPNWYLDLTMIGAYWGNQARRAYHRNRTLCACADMQDTAPISMNYALREALRIVIEEGLEERWQRHTVCAIFAFARLAF